VAREYPRKARPNRMLSKPLTEISAADIHSLVINGTREGRSLEFKRDAVGGKERRASKRAKSSESLADCAASPPTTTLLPVQCFSSNIRRANLEESASIQGNFFDGFSRIGAPNQVACLSELPT
jgi:hypothetical protein